MRIQLAGRSWWRHARFAGLTVATVAMLVATATFFSSAPVQAQLAALFRPAPLPPAIVDGAKMPLLPSFSTAPAPRMPALQIAAPVQPTAAFMANGESHNAPVVLSPDLPTPLVTTEAIARRPLLREPDSGHHATLAPAQPEAGRLVIPALGLSQVVTHVPVVAGQWDVSGLESGIGLLQTTGKQPGDDLAMAFIGHVTVAWPGTGPFADLIQLEHGEEVIYRWQGVDYVYEVERIFLVSPHSVAALYVQDGRRILLATCSDWDYLNWNYAKRLVTQARLVRQEPVPYR